MMKQKLFLFGILAVAMNTAWSAPVKELKTDKDRLSYAIGVSVAKNLKKQGTDFDLDILVQGLKSGLSGDKLLLSDKDMHRVMNNFQAEVRRSAAVTKRQTMDENKKKGEAFFEANKGKEGVVTLASGVQYKIIKAGKGRKPTEADLVQVNFRETLLDGTELESPDHPVTIKASALIQGWKEALTLMPVGSKWQIFIPSQLAYGERGVGAEIGPNETLIVEMEVLEIK